KRRALLHQPRQLMLNIDCGAGSIFRMAPIHHHYELKGWPEPRVIVRFWIISLMLVLIGLATLKVR
ncbi:hypothetical protein ACUOA8_23690, partial [Escherichia sp. SS-MK2]